MECPASFRAKTYFIENGNISRGGQLGYGAYGIVYEGGLLGDETQHAFKYIHRFLVQSNSAMKFSMEQFERECELTRRLSNPNVVKFVGVSFDRRVPVLVTELLECSLTDVLGCRHCSVPYHREIDIALDIAKGLDYLHSQEIVHRDLSSNNILLERDYTAKIADLGVAKSMDENFCTPMPGTPCYMPPEVYQHTLLSPALDLYSYAIVLIHLETRADLKPVDKIEKIPENLLNEEKLETKQKVEVDEVKTEEAGLKGEKRKPVRRSKPHNIIKHRVRSEYERWKHHVELMNKDGVLHRIVKCYLKDGPEQRETTELSQVIAWLEEETHSAEYKSNLETTDPKTPLEHRTRGHNSGRRHLSSSSSTTSSLPLPRPRREKGRARDSDSGFYSETPQRSEDSAEWQLVGGGQVPSSSESRRGLLGRLSYNMMRMSTVLGLSSVGEDDEEYRERVLGSLC